MKVRYTRGMTVVVPQLIDGRLGDAAGLVVATSGMLVWVRLLEGPNTGKVLDFPERMTRVPAPFEVVAEIEMEA